MDETKREARTSGGHRRGHLGNELLRRVHEAERFPTPCATDHKGSSRPGQRRGQLSEAVEASPHKHPFPTPSATAYGSSGNGTGNNKASRGRPSLERMVRFPTPTATDSESSGSQRSRGGKAHAGTSLTDFVLESEGIPRGSPSRRGRLNPRWVEWLMGWPIGWCSSEPLATDRFREWQRQHTCGFDAA